MMREEPPQSASLQVACKSSGIRDEVFSDPRYPLHRISEKLRPYLEILVREFNPEQVILFGSYANGTPDGDSDVDLLIVKEMNQSRTKEATAILRAWRGIRWNGNSLPLELILETPASHLQRIAGKGAFYLEIVRSGVRLV